MALKKKIFRTAEVPEFVYRGNAVAASGYLTKRKGKPVRLSPKVRTIHGESSLPVNGGVSVSDIENPDLAWKEWINYGACHTDVQGVDEDGAKVTTIRSSVSNVSITTSPSPQDEAPGIRSVTFAAGQLALGVKSVHRYEGEAEFELLRKETQVKELFLVVTPLKGDVNRIPIEVRFHDDLLRCKTLQAMKDAGHARLKNRRTSAGYYVSSVVQDVFLGGKSQGGNVIRWPGFGTIYFGEMLVNEYNRRITLVRIRMGSDPGGEAALCATDPNGIWRNE